MFIGRKFMFIGRKNPFISVFLSYKKNLPVIPGITFCHSLRWNPFLSFPALEPLSVIPDVPFCHSRRY